MLKLPKIPVITHVYVEADKSTKRSANTMCCRGNKYI